MFLRKSLTDGLIVNTRLDAGYTPVVGRVGIDPLFGSKSMTERSNRPKAPASAYPTIPPPTINTSTDFIGSFYKLFATSIY